MVGLIGAPSGGSPLWRWPPSSGADTVYGDAGADDIVGGSAAHYVNGTLTKLPNTLDTGDVISGSNADGSAAGDAGDVVLGDNGLITRPGGVDPNTGDPLRTVQLFDMGFVGSTTPPADVSGDDNVSGFDGRDYLSGQAGNDTLFGGNGDDFIEGGAGTDTVFGQGGDDDIVGGSSEKSDGLLDKGAFPTATNAADAGDRLSGGDGHDEIAGDNAVINRKVDGSGLWLHYSAPWTNLLQRDILVPNTAESAGAFGDDTVDAGSGHDEVIGELGNDTIAAKEGDDTVLGDLGKITTTINAGPAQTITADSNFVTETVNAPGSRRRTVEL